MAGAARTGPAIVVEGVTARGIVVGCGVAGTEPEPVIDGDTVARGEDCAENSGTCRPERATLPGTTKVAFRAASESREGMNVSRLVSVSCAASSSLSVTMSPPGL